MNNSNKYKKKLLSIVITAICSTSFTSQATTIWTDADFVNPKGSLYLYSDTFEIHNTNTVTFQSSTDTPLRIGPNAHLIADNNVKILGTRNIYTAFYIGESGSAYLKGDLSVENSHPDNQHYAIGVINNGSSIQVDGKSTFTGYRGFSAQDSTTAIFNGDTEINAVANGISAETGSITLKNTYITMNGGAVEDMFGLRSSNNGSVVIDGLLDLSMNIDSNSYWSYGVYSRSFGKVELKDTKIAFNDSTDAAEIGLYSGDNGTTKIDGDLTILNSDPSIYYKYAIYTSNNGLVTSTNSVANIAGNIYAEQNSLIDLAMNSNSFWQGHSSINSNAQIVINMDNTVWNMNNNSMLTNLTASNSNIQFLSSDNNYFTLTTDELSGSNNHFYMNTDLGSINTSPNNDGEKVGTAGVNGDSLVIATNNTSTNNILTITNNGKSTTQGNEVLQIVSTSPNNEGDFTLNNKVEAGGYEYQLRKSNDPNQAGWQLFGNGQTSTTAKAAVNSHFNVSYLLTYIDNKTLLQRMGELRENQNHEGDFWIKGYGGKLDRFDNPQLDSFNMKYVGTQFGADKVFDINSGLVYLGAMTSYAVASPNYNTGSGTSKSFSLGGYVTYLDKNGVYFDTILKYTNIRNKFSVKDTQNQTVQGHSKSNGYGISFEVGKQFMIKESPFYLEPQLQLAYQYQDGDDFSASNGLEMRMSSYNSLLGRASGIFGYKFTSSNKVQFNVYMKTGFVKEFSGNSSYWLNNSKEQYSFKGNWFDNGIGLNANINNSHQIYGELDYSSGSRFDKTQINLGYRFQF